MQNQLAIISLQDMANDVLLASEWFSLDTGLDCSQQILLPRKISQKNNTNEHGLIHLKNIGNDVARCASCKC